MILNKCGCDSSNHYLVKKVQSNGAILYGFQCRICRKMIGAWLKHSEVKQTLKGVRMTLDEIPNKL